MLRMLMIGTLLALMFVIAQAQKTPDCANTSFQSELNECSYLEFEKADKQLNALWPQVKSDAEEKDKGTGEKAYFTVLLESQRAWLAYRDAECKRVGHMALGGSMEPMLESACKRSMTEERIKALKDRMEQ